MSQTSDTRQISITVNPAAGSAGLLEQSDLTYQGGFRLPQSITGDGNGYGFKFAYGAMCWDHSNGVLIKGGHFSSPIFAPISVPTLVNSSTVTNLNTASYLQEGFINLRNAAPNTDLGDGENFNGSTSSGPRSRALHVTDSGKFIIGTYIGYDGGSNGDNVWVIFDDLDFSAANVTGLYPGFNKKSGGGGGLQASYCCRIPDAHRAGLGGHPFAAGGCSMSAQGRSSFGWSLFGFDPADITGSAVTDYDEFMYYSGVNAGTVNSRHLRDFPTPYQGLYWTSGCNYAGGMVFIDNTDTVLFFGAHPGQAGTDPPTQPTYDPDDICCYGTQSFCQDPLNINKGYHPLLGDYAYRVWAYDVNDLKDVVAGTIQSHEVTPYALWNLTFPHMSDHFDEYGHGHDFYQIISGACYDRTNKHLYLAQQSADIEGPSNWSSPIIHRYVVNDAT